MDSEPRIYTAIPKDKIPISEIICCVFSANPLCRILQLKHTSKVKKKQTLLSTCLNLTLVQALICWQQCCIVEDNIGLYLVLL